MCVSIDKVLDGFDDALVARFDGTHSTGALEPCSQADTGLTRQVKTMRMG